MATERNIVPQGNTPGKPTEKISRSTNTRRKSLFTPPSHEKEVSNKKAQHGQTYAWSEKEHALSLLLCFRTEKILHPTGLSLKIIIFGPVVPSMLQRIHTQIMCEQVMPYEVRSSSISVLILKP